MGGPAEDDRKGKSTAFELKSYKAENNAITNQFGGKKMIYKYEIACREAGLSEEKTAEIRKFFDAEQKKLKRLNEKMENSGLFTVSVNAIDSENYDFEVDTYDIEDPTMDVENMVIKKMELSVLRSCMEELSQDDKEFLLACFTGERGAIMELAKKLGLPQTTVSSRKKRLFEQVKKSFLEKYEKN